jgi:hypothetical protein
MEILEPVTFPVLVNVTSRYLANLEEFGFFFVAALPKASIIGFRCRIFASRFRFGA